MHNKELNKKYETFWYYLTGKKICNRCNLSSHHYLLKYRSYLVPWLRIFPSDTRYYSICSNCMETKNIASEGEIAKIIQKLPSKMLFKYENEDPQASFKNIIEKHLDDL